MIFALPFSLFSNTHEVLVDSRMTVLLEQREDYINEKEEERIVKTYNELMKERKENDLKGGMMVLGGLSSLALGGLSFYLSDYFYNQYQQAGQSSDAKILRGATQTADLFKYLFSVAGIGIAAASSYYFLEGESAKELDRYHLFEEKKDEIFILR